MRRFHWPDGLLVVGSVALGSGRCGDEPEPVEAAVSSSAQGAWVGRWRRRVRPWSAIGQDRPLWPPHPSRRKRLCSSGCPAAPGNGGPTGGGRCEVSWWLRLRRRAPTNRCNFAADAIAIRRHAASWGFAVHLASKNGYEPSALPNGQMADLPEDVLDCACGLYLSDPTAWT